MPIENPLLNQVADAHIPSPDYREDGMVGDAIARAGKAVAEIVTENKERALQDQLLTEQDAFLERVEDRQQALEGPLSNDVIAQAIGQPGGGEAIAGEDAAMRGFLEDVARLRLAADQGALDPTSLMIRQEALVRAAMGRHPRLAQRFQAAASEVLGYNPIGAEIEALGRAARASKGAEDDTLEMLDELADELNIDLTLKIRDPKQYYGQLVHEADWAARVAMQDRRLQLLQKTNAYSKEEMLLEMSRVSPAYAAAELSRVIGVVRRQLGTTPQQRLQGIQAGAFEQVQASLRSAKANFQQQVQARYAAPGLSPEDIDKQFRHVYDYYDFAISKAGDPHMLETVENYLKSQRASVLVKHPTINELSVVLEMLGKLPQDSELSIAIGRSLGSEAATIFGKVWGGIVEGATSTFRPDGTLNPTAALEGLTPNLDNFARGPEADLARGTKLARNFRTALGEANKLASPEAQDRARRAIVAGVGQWSRDYRNRVEADRRRPEASLVREWSTLVAADEFRDLMAQVPEREALPFAQNINWMLSFEQNQLLEEARQMLQRAATTTRVSFGGGPIGSDLPASREVALDFSVGEAVVVEVDDDGSVAFSIVPENSPRGSRLDPNARRNLSREAGRLNQILAPRLTETIRGLAHVNRGDYQFYAAELVDRAKLVVR